MANLVTRVREKLKLSELELAERLGVNRSTVYRWEHDVSDISGPAKLLLEKMLSGQREATQ
jgi:DNA-binding transcriptional regulator YiaG